MEGVSLRVICDTGVDCIEKLFIEVMSLTPLPAPHFLMKQYKPWLLKISEKHPMNTLFKPKNSEI